MSLPQDAGTAPPRLRLGDLLPTATLGLQSRPLRAALSAVGITIGIAAMVAVLAITRSSESALLAEIDRLGTNLLTVSNGQNLTGTEAELPAHATAMIRRIPGVQHVAPTAILNVPGVYRTNQIPSFETGGLALRACDPSLLATLGATVRQGRFLTAATARFPVAVLGYQAAQTLGIPTLDHPVRIYAAGQWLDVTGILNPDPLAPEIDRSALIGFPAARLLGYDGHATTLYVRTAVGRTTQVATLLGPSANPENPTTVAVSQPSAALSARIAVAGASTALFLGLGAVALLVGGIGIANVMVIGVLERRPEIGLRRALGATKGHIAAQFLTESAILATIGGLAGILLGAMVTAALANARHWGLLVPPLALWGSLLTAVAIGSIAGLYPAYKAARLPPAKALRTV
jgi:putative ABC transport system permease protein